MSLSSKEYFIRETGKSIKRNGIMSFASISTVAVSLLVLGMFLLMYLNTDNLAKYLESQVEMTVYLEDTATGEEVADIREKLKKMEGVVKVTEVTKAMAMDRFKNRLGDQATLLKALGKDNPFPLTRVLRLGGAVLIVFLCFATLFIIINTIRLTVFARRREVVIMKYVGATDWFIRWPFMLEGMTLGLGGGVIACAIVDLIYVSLSGRLHTTFAFFPILQSWPTLLYADLFILACGTLIGALGSYLSLKKFLRV